MKKPDRHSVSETCVDDSTFSPGFNRDEDRLLLYSSSKEKSWARKLRCLLGCIHYAFDDDHRIVFPKQNTIKHNVYLPPKKPNSQLRTLILDLDETLVHSSFVPTQNCDILIPVEITGRLQNVYVKKRPHVDEFLSRVKHLYEIIIFTASLPIYADPVISQLDKYSVVSHRLFREHCIRTETGYVKDLTYLGRDLDDIVIVDNSPQSYARQPFNSVPISSWFGESESDRTLIDTVLPILEEIARDKSSVQECTRRLSLSNISSENSVFVDEEVKIGFGPDDDNIIASMLLSAETKKQ